MKFTKDNGKKPCHKFLWEDVINEEYKEKHYSHTIKKFTVVKMLEIFKEKGCKTIDEAITLLNSELEKDTDIVFSWKIN